MSFRLLCKKLARYFSCAVKYTAAAAAAPFAGKKAKYRDLWLISERGFDARDNGYYLFRYITGNCPEINAAYVIADNSPDRVRIEGMGRLVRYNSMEHFITLICARVRISTHIMGFTPYIDFFVRADKLGLVRGKKIFLQHGIIKDNLTYLYNNNVNIDLFVCSAKPEFDYINANYGYPEGVVRMLGLCRYDELKKIETPSKRILVMPTWRYNLQGVDRHEFTESKYFRAFDSLLNSPRVKELLEKYGYELVFYPHIEMQKFIDCFKSGGRVRALSFKDSTVQELLINSDVLITDFSSVFFDYAYMEKPMLFYQFDEEEFRRQHYGEGYFNYSRDGFGEVVYDEDALISSLEVILQKGAVIEDKYKKRLDSFFTIRDKNNCKRNFEAIKELI